MADYRKIIKYKVNAICTQPLHIGNALGNKEEVLIHPVDDTPFIQASSLAGIFRAYHKTAYSEERSDKLFGTRKHEENENSYEAGSLLKFSDGLFLNNKDHKVLLELRPRVAINRETGTVEASKNKGTVIQSGHKFNMEYIGAGAEISFEVYLYDEEFKADVEDIFAAIHSENIQIGGQKSNGCGYIRLEGLMRRCFDMVKAEDRKLWAMEDCLEEKQYEDILSALNISSKVQKKYEVIVEGKTENELLIKSIAVSDYGKETPDAMNIRNAKKEYIVPGSSLKGAVRSQMEKIAGYLGQSKVISDSFGVRGNGEESGSIGNLSFYDTIVGEKEDNDKAEISYRIHIDKFTGGVFQQGLFSEKNISGNLRFKITIADRNQPDKTCGLLLMALRDLGIGTLNIGSGYSTGKGIIKVSKILVNDPKSGEMAVIDFEKNRIENETMISRCILSIQEKEA